MFCRETMLLSSPSIRAGASAPVIRGRCSDEVCVVYLEGSIRVPVNGELRHAIRQLLQSGARQIVLDLGRISAIDAAGVGQLVRAYNMTSAANGALRVANASPRVRKILDRAGLFGLLAAVPTAQKDGLWHRPWVMCQGRA